MTYKMTPERAKALTEMIGKKWHDYKLCQNTGNMSRCSCGAVGCYVVDNCTKENRTFQTDDDMMEVFRCLVDNTKWGDFCDYATDYFVDNDIGCGLDIFVAWLFYDSERFCVLVAMAKEEGAIK
jgi:hypothetical protein